MSKTESSPEAELSARNNTQCQV